MDRVLDRADAIAFCNRQLQRVLARRQARARRVLQRRRDAVHDRLKAGVGHPAVGNPAVLIDDDVARRRAAAVSRGPPPHARRCGGGRGARRAPDRSAAAAARCAGDCGGERCGGSLGRGSPGPRRPRGGVGSGTPRTWATCGRPHRALRQSAREGHGGDARPVSCQPRWVRPARGDCRSGGAAGAARAVVLLHTAAADRADAAARGRGGAGLDRLAASMVRRHNASVLGPRGAPGAPCGVDPAATHQPGVVLRPPGAAGSVAFGCRRSAGSEWSEAAAAACPVSDDDRHASAGRGHRGYVWAELMRRTFGIDVLDCPRCGGRLRLLALIEHARIVERILRHLGLPTDRPAPRPARAPPRRVDDPASPVWVPADANS